MAEDAQKKYAEKFIDSDTYEVVDEDEGNVVEFFMEALPNQLLSDGGEIERKHPLVKELRKMEQEALTALRQQEPFTDEEPQPPAKDALPAAQRAYQETHGDWDARRLAHEESLRERTAILRDHHEHASLLTVARAGRPVYAEVECIQIRTPGDLSSLVQRPIRPEDKEKYPEKYRRFKAGLSQETNGTPLTALGVSKSQIKELAYYGIATVQQLASVNDANLARVGTYMALRQQAKDYLATAKGAAPINEARAEAAKLREEMAVLRRQMAEMQEAQPSRAGKRQQPQP